MLAVADAGWHPGAIGIVASRLEERIDPPAMVMAIAEGAAKGAGRAVQLRIDDAAPAG